MRHIGETQLQFLPLQIDSWSGSSIQSIMQVMFASSQRALTPNESRTLQKRAMRTAGRVRGKSKTQRFESSFEKRTRKGQKGNGRQTDLRLLNLTCATLLARARFESGCVKQKVPFALWALGEVGFFFCALPRLIWCGQI